jgi:hypothetical protein
VSELDGGTAISNEEPELLPKVTPYLANQADVLCTRRLRAEYTNESGTKDPVNRGRLRQAFIDAVRAWSEVGTRPPVSAHLEPEEKRIVEHALGWYECLFPIAAETIETPIDDREPTPLPRRGIRLGGWVDLCVVRDDGSRELRQLAFGAARIPQGPLDLPAMRAAVLRLAQSRWVDDEVLSLVWVDLLAGVKRETTVRIPADLAALAGWLDERIDVVEARIATPEPMPGRDCASCKFVPRCPAHDLRGSMMTRRDDLLPAVLTLSPTALETWHRCPREWRNHRLLGLPDSDPQHGTSHGLYLHDLLRHVHEHGSCHDPRHVSEVIAANGGDARAAEEIQRHAARCPVDAQAIGHESEWVRVNPSPPVFLASARLDAVWLRDGVLEVRDYKTGQRVIETIQDDPRARLQAWVAAPRALQHDARLRIRYEYLAAEVTEDPEPWEPDDEELAQIDLELRETVAAMRAQAASHEWAGVADPDVCGRCRYRSICPESATPSEPAWASIELSPA